MCARRSATADGTWIVKEEDVLEQAIISGIASDSSEAKMTILGVPGPAGHRGRVFRPLADAGIHIDMIVQNISAAGRTDISFTLPQSDLAGAEPMLERSRSSSTRRVITCDSDIAKVSLVGAGMRSNPGVAADMFEALADAGINIEIISTSSIRISCVVTAPISTAPCRCCTTASSSPPSRSKKGGPACAGPPWF